MSFIATRGLVLPPTGKLIKLHYICTVCVIFMSASLSHHCPFLNCNGLRKNKGLKPAGLCAFLPVMLAFIYAASVWLDENNVDT